MFLAVIVAGALSWSLINLLSKERAVAYLEAQGAILRYEYLGVLGALRLHKQPVEIFMTRPVDDADSFFREVRALESVRWFGANALVDTKAYSTHLNELAKRGIVIRE